MAESPARTAFAEEALTHLDTLYRGALRLTRDPDSAQDLVQEAYLRALRYQHSYQPGTNMKAWLFAIMRNLFWDRFKGSRKEDVSLDDVGERLSTTSCVTRAQARADVLDKLAATEVVAASAAPAPPRGGAPGRRRGLLIQGRCPDAWRPDRHRDVAPAPGKAATSKIPL
jgi:RNA polymerase sigma-70 factor (ECF subfamily)